MRRWLLLVLGVGVLALPAVALAAVNGTFKGKTSQGLKFQLTIRGGKVQGSASVLHYKDPCRKSSAVFMGASSPTGSLRGNSFAVVNAHYQESIPPGYKGFHTTTLRFTVSGHKVSGSFSDSVKIYKGGKLRYRCASGKVSFQARS